MIPVYKPYLPPHILDYARDALNSTWISSQGKYMDLAEEKLKEILGVKYVLLTNNGTTAMHLVAKTLRQLTDAKNILVPNNVYVAAWNAFLYDKNFNLTPIDANLDTWNFDIYSYAAEDPTKVKHWSNAILVVHNLGNMINVPMLSRIFPNIPIVEDACEAFGGTYEGKLAGTASLCSALSFFGNKNVTSGEGGAFITNKKEAYEKARLWWGQGQSSKKFVHSELGYNYRMTNVAAAILYGQLNEYSDIMERKQYVFDCYRHYLKNMDEVLFQIEEIDSESANWMFGIRVIGSPNYDAAEEFFNDAGVETRPMFYPMTAHEHLSNIRGSMVNAEILSKECIILPSYPDLTEIEISFITEKVKEYVKTIR